MTEKDIGLASVLPVSLIVPINILLAKTLPFNAHEVPDELKVSLERTKQLWAWFSKAKDHDKERGTQLGTLGYLPWEVRQKIFGNVFDGQFVVDIDRHTVYLESNTYGEYAMYVSRWSSWCYRNTFPHLWRGLAIRNVSASLRSEVEHAYITMAHFRFGSEEMLDDFLDHLTLYEKSLLRSVEFPLCERFCISESLMAQCARLPSGLTSIIFGFGCYERHMKPEEQLELVDSLQLLGQQLRRCWTPRAEIKVVHYCYGIQFECHKQVVTSALNDLEPWSQSWLDWWASSENHDLAEEQSCPPQGSIDESRGTE